MRSLHSRPSATRRKVRRAAKRSTKKASSKAARKRFRGGLSRLTSMGSRDGGRLAAGQLRRVVAPFPLEEPFDSAAHHEVHDEADQTGAHTPEGSVTQLAEAGLLPRRDLGSTPGAPTKRCGKCGDDKLFDEFAKNKRKNDGRQQWCRACHHAHHVDYYPKNKKRFRDYDHALRERLRAIVFAHLMTNACVDCGEKDPIVLDFDHVRGVKAFNIAVATANGAVSTRTLMEEISKCEIRCANCHRRKTSAEGFHWKTQRVASSKAEQQSLTLSGAVRFRGDPH
jgi:hypothetical protein